MKVLLIGANGQLGSDLQPVLTGLGFRVEPCTRPQLDITNAEQVEEKCASVKPDVVINTAAFHKVEICEKEPATSFAVNAIGPWNLARSCRRHDAVLVHFSTDYVFDGNQSHPYTETDLPHPLNVYGVSKLAGEQIINLSWERHFIVRTCGLYGIAGSRGKGGNFVETMLQQSTRAIPIRVVDDQILTPTFTADLAQAVGALIQTTKYGLYHVSAEGQCSWYEFAAKIFDLAGLSKNLTPVSTLEFASPVRRPAYSVLSKQKLNSLDIEMPSWEDGLRRYLSCRKTKQPLQTT